jgi:hypothetical protein
LLRRGGGGGDGGWFAETCETAMPGAVARAKAASTLQRVTAIGDQMVFGEVAEAATPQAPCKPSSGTGSRGARENDTGHWRRL